MTFSYNIHRHGFIHMAVNPPWSIFGILIEPFFRYVAQPVWFLAELNNLIAAWCYGMTENGDWLQSRIPATAFTSPFVQLEPQVRTGCHAPCVLVFALCLCSSHRFTNFVRLGARHTEDKILENDPRGCLPTRWATVNS